MIAIEEVRREHYGRLAAAFDAVASSYDRIFGPDTNALMSQQRERSIDLLRAVFHSDGSGSALLEIGCGTGDEAIALARRGHRILATDVSPAMIEIMRNRARAAGVADRIDTAALAAGQLASLTTAGNARPFDGAYSSFGALNCEPALNATGAALARLLRPGRPLVVSVLNRGCLWDLLWFGSHGDFRRARRRRQPGPVEAPIGQGGPWVQLRYLDAGAIAGAFSSFTVERVVGLGVLLPPPYLEAVFARRPRLLRCLDWLDRHIMALPAMNQLGDHVAVVLRRRDEQVTHP